ncbi:Acetyl-CoA-benzylalcohol acetyltransferase [Morella rubra]|uniref:Acetyl-CoA-benzylalcohol acetyltransferase n=1 Tax=Morella rubra TaxID=262757 RepID=A0A6A1VR84_9ROSI|nr:Acetyl-CoA-benzylalcohol acetyltransferase [Morella rubra]
MSRKLIKPATPTPPHLRSCRISALDQIALPIYVAFIQYYHVHGDDHDHDQIRERLEKSLSEVLTLYYPLAGRYIRKNLLLDCNDEGVEYSEARVSGELAQVLLQGEVKAELLNLFVPFAMESETTPLVLIQVNRFECGSLAIGLRIAHVVADGIAMTTFFNAWATACRGAGVNEVIRPSFDLASFFPPREITVPLDLPPVDATKSKAFTTKRFVFNGTAISRLKDIARGDADDPTLPKRQQYSRVVVVTALMWKALIGVAQARDGGLRPSLACHPVNMRGRTALPIPDNSCGNFFSGANARFSGESESKMELHVLAGLVDGAIRNRVADCLKHQNVDDLVSFVTNSLREPGGERGDTNIIMFSSWCRFPMYEADFGWGKPIWVSSTHKPAEIVTLMDTKDGKGIEVWVSLDEKDMLLFQKHPDIIAFTS